jgi:hypothetical protein
MCEHTPILDKLYPGCFCIYCGVRIANIEADEYGQIYREGLEREAARRYVAIIHKDQQRVVERLNLDQGRASIRFKGDSDPTNVNVTDLLSAFQDGADEREVLRIR